jgi:hypothetical protein
MAVADTFARYGKGKTSATVILSAVVGGGGLLEVMVM